jgi:hypothetical protein
MATVEIDRPDVVSEVAEAFARYERALLDEDHAELRRSFWGDARVVRFGIAEVQYGPDAIAEWRRRAPHVGYDRTLHHTVITTFGADTAVVATEFGRPGAGTIGRQSQTWLRLPEGWRIVHAHVSVLNADDCERAGAPPPRTRPSPRHR